MSDDYSSLRSLLQLYQHQWIIHLQLSGWIQCNKSSITTRKVQPMHRYHLKDICLSLSVFVAITFMQVFTWVCCCLLFTDIDECLDNDCGDDGTCHNNRGSYMCECHKGFYLVPDATPVCQGLYYTKLSSLERVEFCEFMCQIAILTIYNLIFNIWNDWTVKRPIFSVIRTLSLTVTVPSLDIDECFNSTVCGPDSVCNNTPGGYSCECQLGFITTLPAKDPSETNICIGILETQQYSKLADKRLLLFKFWVHFFQYVRRS